MPSKNPPANHRKISTPSVMIASQRFVSINLSFFSCYTFEIPFAGCIIELCVECSCFAQKKRTARRVRKCKCIVFRIECSGRKCLCTHFICWSFVYSTKPKKVFRLSPPSLDSHTPTIFLRVHRRFCYTFFSASLFSIFSGG